MHFVMLNIKCTSYIKTIKERGVFNHKVIRITWGSILCLQHLYSCRFVMYLIINISSVCRLFATLEPRNSRLPVPLWRALITPSGSICLLIIWGLFPSVLPEMKVNAVSALSALSALHSRCPVFRPAGNAVRPASWHPDLHLLQQGDGVEPRDSSPGCKPLRLVSWYYAAFGWRGVASGTVHGNWAFVGHFLWHNSQSHIHNVYMCNKS